MQASQFGSFILAQFGVQDHQFTKTRVDAGPIVEIAVAAPFRESQLPYCGSKISTNQGRLRQRAMLRQHLSQ
jgi:hypothetical protein